MVAGAPVIGVLALQGAFREHSAMLGLLGAQVREVRLPRQLDGLDGLVIPGGESTTMGKLMETYGLTEPLRRYALEKPVFGTCAGMIVLAKRTVEGGQPLLGVLDVTVRRNAFGRQVHSCEARVDLRLPGSAPDGFRAVFIRSPWVEEAGPEVEVLARHEGRIVAVRQGRVLATAFHPELGSDTRVHEFFLDMVAGQRREQTLGAEVA